jgi:hypothetical protein
MSPEPWGDSGSSGPNLRAAGTQSIELGGNRARLRSTFQAGGGAIEFGHRCSGALLAALVPGQGGGSSRFCIDHCLDVQSLTHNSITLARQALPPRARRSPRGTVSTERPVPSRASGDHASRPSRWTAPSQSIFEVPESLRWPIALRQFNGCLNLLTPHPSLRLAAN